MRGTRPDRRLGQRPIGIIPAYAGNTRLTCRADAMKWDHPRICGEHRTMTPIRPLARGSSPHMRGTPVSHYSNSGRHGIIPAYAGNTGSVLPAMRRYRDHPRICGEHEDQTPLLVWTRGSSPHMRGTLGHIREADFHAGIIPAYAGNTTHFTSISPRIKDHPRICGEHSIRPAKLTGDLGSSPHMRGTPGRLASALSRHGDHPRICGEHGGVAVIRGLLMGSSPHMRGTHGAE